MKNVEQNVLYLHWSPSKLFREAIELIDTFALGFTRSQALEEVYLMAASLAIKSPIKTELQEVMEDRIYELERPYIEDKKTLLKESKTRTYGNKFIKRKYR